jgi:hypothetical protein
MTPNDRKQTRNDHLVEFAKRHQGKWEASLSAHFALLRAKQLLDDARELKPFATLRDSQRHYPESWREGFEIIDYYLVGLVTCLEWHAKARLKDTLEFDPTTLSQDDTKHIAKDVAIIEAIAQELSVADLVVASIRITSAKSYIDKIGRALSQLSVPANAWDFVRAAKVTPIEYHDIKRTNERLFNELFEIRNWLAHEIDGSLVGHPLRRRTIHIDEAIQWGELVVGTISGIENSITKRAPKGFPNQLTEKGTPIDEIALLKADIKSLEALIESAIRQAPEPTSSIDATRFSTCCQEWGALYEADANFIQHSLVFHSRFFDFMTPALRSLLIARRKHLTEIAAAFGSIEVAHT